VFDLWLMRMKNIRLEEKNLTCMPHKFPAEINADIPSIIHFSEFNHGCKWCIFRKKEKKNYDSLVVSKMDSCLVVKIITNHNYKIFLINRTFLFLSQWFPLHFFSPRFTLAHNNSVSTCFHFSITNVSLSMFSIYVFVDCYTVISINKYFLFSSLNKTRQQHGRRYSRGW
jgi:hypothetical protein